MSTENTAAVPAKAIAQYKAAQAAIKQWEEAKAKARADIEKAMGDAEIGTIRGKAVASWPHIKSNRLDQTALKREQPEIHALYVKTAESRRFTLIEDESQED